MGGRKRVNITTIIILSILPLYNVLHAHIQTHNIHEKYNEAFVVVYQRALSDFM